MFSSTVFKISTTLKDMKNGQEYNPQDTTIVIPDNTNIEYTLFNNCSFGANSKFTVSDDFLSKVNAKRCKFRFFNSTTMDENAKIKIKNFDIDPGIEILPDINFTMKEGAKVKITTSKETVFNSLKKVAKANPKIEVSLKHSP